MTLMKPHRTPRLMATLALSLACATPPTRAADAPPTAHQLSFSASASVEVTRDVLTVSLQAMRDGNDAAVVQSALKQVLDAALAEARKGADAGLAVRTDGFNLSPRYGRDGKPNGWTGTAGLTLEGRDIARVAATAGKLTALNIVSTGYSLSRELRERHEAELTAQAIKKFRSRADEMARQFGYSGYQLREVNVQAGESGLGQQPPVVMMQARAMQADAAPLPTEAGKGLLSATVQGSVTLTR